MCISCVIPSIGEHPHALLITLADVRPGDYRLFFAGMMKLREHDCAVLTANLPKE